MEEVRIIIVVIHFYIYPSSICFCSCLDCSSQFAHLYVLCAVPIYTCSSSYMSTASLSCPSIPHASTPLPLHSSTPPRFHFTGVYGDFESFANDLMGVFLDVLDAPAHHLGKFMSKIISKLKSNVASLPFHSGRFK
jgi:hypothetical protein